MPGFDAYIYAKSSLHSEEGPRTKELESETRNTVLFYLRSSDPGWAPDVMLVNILGGPQESGGSRQ